MAEQEITPRIPRRVLVTQIDGAQRDVERYARAWLNERGAVEGFFATYPRNDGIVLEVHDGGPGKAYMPRVLEHVNEPEDTDAEHRMGGVIPAAEKYTVIEVTPHTVRALAIEPDSVHETLAPTTRSMTRYRARPEGPTLAISAAVMGAAVFVAFIALLTRPVPDPIVMTPPSEHSVLDVYDNQVVPLHGAEPGTLRYSEKEWTWQSEQ